MKNYRVMSAELAHETNTFCVLPTTLADFVERNWLLGEEALAARGNLNTPLAGFVDVARTEGWSLSHVLSADAPPAGRVSDEAFEAMSTALLTAWSACVEAGQPFDGVLLGLHGAMASEHFDDGDGELLRRLRQATGPALPIAITLDPHANVSRAMCDAADIMVSYRTYPHTDMRVAGQRAASLLQRAMADEIRPRCFMVRRPMLEEASGGRTDVGPMIDRLRVAAALEQQPDVFVVNINAGFASADVREVGPTVVVTAQGDITPALRVATGLADDIWARRHETLDRFHSASEAAVICQHYQPSLDKPGPLLVADYADNPGGGAYGDSTALLAAMLALGVQHACFGALYDPATVQQLALHQPGDHVQVSLGGKTDPLFGGPPLQLRVKLMRLSEGHYTGSGVMLGGLQRSWGPTAVVQVDGIEVLVVSRRSQVLDLQQFQAFGIHPERQRVVVLKSMQHFRAAFEPLAGRVILCDSGALCTLDYRRLNYCNVPRPMSPLDDGIDIDAWLMANEGGVVLPNRP